MTSSSSNAIETPAHSFSEMRMRDNKKIRGDIFEEFCVLYLTEELEAKPEAKPKLKIKTKPLSKEELRAIRADFYSV